MLASHVKYNYSCKAISADDDGDVRVVVHVVVHVTTRSRRQCSEFAVALPFVAEDTKQSASQLAKTKRRWSIAVSTKQLSHLFGKNRPNRAKTKHQALKPNFFAIFSGT
jgi:hypothetical protein